MTDSKTEMDKSQKELQHEQQKKASRMKYLRILGIVAILILLIAVFAGWRTAGQQQDEESIATLPPNLQGLTDAPVKIVEYSDFGCSSCRAWHNSGIKETIQETYGDQISFEYRHYPIITSQSPKAAEAGQCAAEQNKFWEYHDHIFENTAQGALSIDDLNEYASAVGLNQSQFSQCLESGKYTTAVREQWNSAVDQGARGTPTFFVNGRQTSPMFELLKVQIETELAN